MTLLRRKIDSYLNEWKANDTRKPLIVKGARQIGKTTSIMQFATTHYPSVEGGTGSTLTGICGNSGMA